MFRTPYNVRFADVDNAGIFYYPRFFHAFHVAFEEFWRHAGRPYHLLLGEDRIGFPAVHIEADFNKPVTFGDPLEIRLGLKRMGRTSLVFHFDMVHTETGEVHAAVDITNVAVDMDRFEAIPVPQQVRDAVEPLRMDATDG
ncbi:MAG: acyl-CoA thioesterase [Planctomycetota bacterium]